MKQGQSGQLSRYGAIAKEIPFITGKAFFLINASETAASEFLNTYTVDGEGVTRVYTSWAAVITAIQASTDADVVFVSPLFTTAPTKAQQLALDAAYVTVIQAAQGLPDGSYLSATLTAVSLAAAATTVQNLFQVNGRCILQNIMGEVVTSIGSTANGKFTLYPTVGTNTDLCAAATTSSLAVGGQLLITGTLANAMVTTVNGAFINQAGSVVLTAGTLAYVNAVTSTGNVKFRVKYVPVDPGAFISPLI